MNLLDLILYMPGCGGAQGPTGGVPAGKEQPWWSMPLIILAMAVIFYLFFIRPQSKRNKELKKFRENLKRGDKVITGAGIHGKILEVGDSWCIIETEGQGKLKIEKMAITSSTSGDQSSS